MDTIRLENEALVAELDAVRPVVAGYIVKPAGTRIGGAGREGALAINGKAVPWEAWDISVRSDGGKAAYDLRHPGTGWRLVFEFRLDGSSLVMTCEVAGDPEGTLALVGFSDLALVTCTGWDFTYWREDWMQAHWDAWPGWPEPIGGTYHCRGPQRQKVKYAVPDAIAQPTVHACAYDGKLCCFVRTNYLHLPLVTRVLPSERYRARSEAFAIGPNDYQYRVRAKTLPPLEARAVFLADTNGDGLADESDYYLWLNRNSPAPNPLYRETLWHKIFLAQPGIAEVTTYRQAIEIIEAIHNVTDHVPQMTYLVGWQYNGHDTGYPALDRLNPAVGSREELLDLIRIAKERFGCTISYHINLDDAYKEEPGWDEDIISRDVDGELMAWQVFNGRQSYHISHAKDAETGKVFRRLEAMLDLVPVEKTLHMDAFRYSDLSWGPDGDIGPMEELVCGVRPILDYLAARGIDVSTEAVNGWAMDCPGWFSAVWHMDYWWKVQMHHGRILGGGRYAALGGWGLGASINGDFTYGRLQHDWPAMLDAIYLGSMLYRFYLGREMVEFHAPPHQALMRFGDGVRIDLEERKNHLEVTWGDVLVATGHDRFIPEGDTIHVYSRDGCKRAWTLPAGWRGAQVEAYALSRTGRQPAPRYELSHDTISISLPPRTPVKLVKCG